MGSWPNVWFLLFFLLLGPPGTACLWVLVLLDYSTLWLERSRPKIYHLSPIHHLFAHVGT
jgi:hypothetical protein